MNQAHTYSRKDLDLVLERRKAKIKESKDNSDECKTCMIEVVEGWYEDMLFFLNEISVVPGIMSELLDLKKEVAAIKETIEDLNVYMRSMKGTLDKVLLEQFTPQKKLEIESIIYTVIKERRDDSTKFMTWIQKIMYIVIQISITGGMFWWMAHYMIDKA